MGLSSTQPHTSETANTSDSAFSFNCERAE
jgi:hypothetical protein